MKNAPSLKYQPKDKFTEVIIFAGTDAYSHAQHWIESEGRKHGDNVPPVYLGPKQLADLENIRIIDEKRRFARVYLAGEIEPIQINAIAEKLALAGVQEAKLYKGITDQEPENWRDYLQRIREQAEREEML
ncbi:TPA: DNA primase, partial [Escherichia coli]|nr:DNA primase [Escherichia coli]